MKKNIAGFSLVIAMGLVLVSSLLAYTILEYMIPFSKNIKGIENSTKSYYMANNGIEKGLYFFSKREGKGIEDEDTSRSTFSGDYDYKYDTFSSGTILPLPGEGNSEFDPNWNKIELGHPIQLSVGYNSLQSINSVDIDFRVPDLDLIEASPREKLAGDVTPKINWQLSSQIDTLNSSVPNLITVDKINGGEINLSSLNGEPINILSDPNLGAFYNANCGANQKCILKFSVISDLKTDSNPSINIPYLEWQMNLGTGNNLPLRYSIIESTGKSYGFSKTLELKYPQETVSEAFDFTVFQ